MMNHAQHPPDISSLRYLHMYIRPRTKSRADIRPSATPPRFDKAEIPLLVYFAIVACVQSMLIMIQVISPPPPPLKSAYFSLPHECRSEVLIPCTKPCLKFLSGEDLCCRKRCHRHHSKQLNEELKSKKVELDPYDRRGILCVTEICQ